MKNLEPPVKRNWREWVGFVLLNFATPIAFFWMFRFYGAKPAISLAILVTLVQVAVHLWLRIRFSPFFIVASGFTVLLGTIDLFLASPWFFRLEPFAQNFIMGMIFSLSLFTRVSILGWFANALPEVVRPRMGEESARYLRRVTLVWSIYFFAKAFLFLYIALHVDLGVLILLRSLIGGVTLVMMVAGEIAYRKLFRERRLRRGG